MELSSKIVKSQSHFREGDTIIKGLSNGYLSVLSEETAKKLQEDPSVEIVEEDKSVGILKQEIFDFGFRDIIGKSSMHLMIQHDAPWGLSFLSGENTSKGDYVFLENAGEGVDVYVIDSGVMVDHPDFEGRARFGANLVEGSPDMDENGHGTHCAGTIGGSKYGVAKRANIVAVKVLDGYGQGMISRVMQGIDFVIKEHEEKTDMMYKMSMQKYFDHKMRENYLLGFAGKRSTSIRSLNDVVNDFVSQSMYPKTVINMSVGGEKSRALDFAIDYAVSLGIHISVAAGNEKESACRHSPGSAMYAVTSGAFKEDNKMAEFSNYGKCVDIYAPGVNILSAWNDGSYRIASGTSMAAPHTSGVMALYLSYKDFTPKDLKKTIIDDATCTVADQKTSSYIWPFNLIFNTNNLPALSTHNLIKKYKKSQN